MLNGKPLAIDLFCGLGGWADGFLAEGYRVIGFDIERHEYRFPDVPGSYCLERYPGQLVLQDVLTLHGSQFRNAAVIVASPPCQAYSYRAMPWKRAKALPPPDNTLFEACFRIQREACEAAGRHIPLIVENVCGAQKWVGRARWHYGSYYLWGDVPALMPFSKIHKLAWDNTTSRRCRRIDESLKTVGHVNQRDGYSHTRHLTNQAESDAIKVSGDWFGSYEDMKAKGTISPGRLHGKNSVKRAAASARIAKIPFPLAQWIAQCFKP